MDDELAPLLADARNDRPRPSRTVTFSADPVTRTIEPDSEGRSASLNSKLRRRNSHGGVAVAQQTPLPAGASGLAKIGPQRSTKKTEKLKLLPNPDIDEEGGDEESGRDVYSQYTRIKDPTARRDAARLGKGDRSRLPRVTAYCTANRYHMDGLMRFLKSRGKTRGANPKLIDECIYTPYASKETQPFADASNGASQAHPDDAEPPVAPHPVSPDFDTQVHTPEVFLFDYGVVVVWGMSEGQEVKLLRDIAKFEVEKLAPDDVEVERFNFYYTQEYQARIYNDFITLRDKNNYMTKLAISHALAQSVKTSLFEELIASTIGACKDIPTQIALTGKIDLSRSQINMQIGELFILRINIHLNGSVLDTPELFWVEPQLEPVYQAVRSYLEMDQRVGLITERLDVIADLLAVLKDQLSHGHDEKLEWIVIVLIAMEILVAAVNIVVDLYAGEA
ncbi:hypothetical protein CDD81_5177 [Ophiocordyceps australis]|uniref:DUF155 domain-containing protein n=1 Tax=Ophiocordyceps australis TaxID=1399860 RepID=A0A2C5XIL1_9HYPO|nr:hypothetical protein CDD81_5177 [Ophiocordyceps australis]